MFWVIATASGLLGLAISFTSMWFLNQTSPTTYRYNIPLPICLLVHANCLKWILINWKRVLNTDDGFLQTKETSLEFSMILDAWYFYVCIHFIPLYPYLLLTNCIRSLVGSLNKIPISIAGLMLFNVPLSLPNIFSILFGNLTIQTLSCHYFIFPSPHKLVDFPFFVFFLCRFICWNIVCKGKNVLMQN